MKRALTLTTGLAIGYVAGAHAGRERYEQMKQKAQELSQQPAVADARSNLMEHAEAATKVVAEKVTDATSELAHKLHMGSEQKNGSSPVGTA
jgi:hypothetical protein